MPLKDLGPLKYPRHDFSALVYVLSGVILGFALAMGFFLSVSAPMYDYIGFEGDAATPRAAGENESHLQKHSWSGLRNASMTYVGPSRRHGKGVFALKDIKASELIVVCDYIEGDRPSWTYFFSSGAGLADYFVTANGKRHPVFMLGICPLVNHGCKGMNVKSTFDHDSQVVTFVAKRSISAGEELLIDYGPGYWCTRELTAGRLPWKDKCQCLD